jgi:DICT domain-containing protein
MSVDRARENLAAARTAVLVAESRLTQRIAERDQAEAALFAAEEADTLPDGFVDRQVAFMRDALRGKGSAS